MRSDDFYTTEILSCCNSIVEKKHKSNQLVLVNRNVIMEFQIFIR